MIWIVALGMVGLFAFFGRLQGVVRAAFIIAGATLGAILAVPLAGVMRRIVSVLGMEHALWLQVVPPFLVFFVILVLMIVAGVSMHQKISIHFQHKASDLQRLRWERLEQHLGLSLGVVQGVLFFILLMIPIYTAGYFTRQVASDGSDPVTIRVVNSLSDQIRSSKLDRVVAAYSPRPGWYLHGADVVGLLYHNPLLQSRLWRYPSLLSLSERPEFQALANDVEFNQLLQTRSPFPDILRHEAFREAMGNPEVARQVADTLGEDVADLYEFLKTGRSPKYAQEKILGLWTLDIQGTLNDERKRRPTVPVAELNRVRRILIGRFGGASLAATPDSQAALRKPVDLSTPAAGVQVIGEGTWESFGRNYRIHLTTPRTETVEVTIEGEDRLLFSSEGLTMVFERDIGQ